MAAEPTTRRPTLAVFASDRGPGDPERSSLMSLAGHDFAQRGARLISVAHDGYVAVPLITGARAVGGEVLVVADEQTPMPGALGTVPVERLADPDACLARVAEHADIFVGLPGSLASSADLYRTWVRAGGGASGKPIVLLNRNRAYEVIRGLAADVLTHSVRRQERMLVITDNPDDLWNKIAWALAEAGHPVGG